jgi:outer membrane protein assembly factor BamB
VKLKLSPDGSKAEVVWRNSSLDNQMGGVILHEGRLYGAGHNNRQLICLDWDTGEELYSTSEFQRGNTIFAEGLLYCYDERGKVGLIQPGENDFNILGEFEVTYGERQHWAHLVINDKKLYVRHGDALMVYSIAR